MLETDYSSAELFNFWSVARRHLVSLGYTDRSSGNSADYRGGQGRAYRVSGFVVSVSDEWYLVTAGHVMREIHQALQEGHEFLEWRLHDAKDASDIHQDPIPFDFPGAWRDYSDNDSIGDDYALIHLSAFYISLLRANGIEPLAEPAWRDKAPDDCDSFCLIGHPDHAIQDMSDDVQSVCHNAIPLLRGEPQPGSPWLHFRLPTAAIPDVIDLKGTSGGPIFALSRQGESIRYWVVGIQSSWVRSGATVKGCKLRNILLEVEKRLSTGLCPGQQDRLPL